MLSPYRVLDCTDGRGQLAGLMLAQLGAEVLLVEPPGGTPSRLRPPFIGDAPDPERGLWHWAYNRGKRSVVIDTAVEDGRRELADLAATADVLLWSGLPAECPFDLDELTSQHPHLVVVALTPFGLDGPKAGWRDSDLIVSASSCQLILTGDTDRPPLRMGSPQAHLHGAADAAVGALMALTERHRSGRGQLVDVSAQVSCMQASFAYSINEAWSAPPMGRAGDGINLGNWKLRWTYPAKDGEVTITVVYGTAMAPFMGNLFQWIWEEGGCDEATRDKPWADLWMQIESGEESPTEIDRLADVIAAFTSRHTKAELVAEAAPPAGAPGPHRHARPRCSTTTTSPPGPSGTTSRIPRPATPRRVPGRFVVASGAPLHPLGPPPELGERRTARRTAAAAAPRRSAPPAEAGTGPRADADAGALAGLKAIDLTWSVAGPLVGRNLADFGATVVRVESSRRPDLARAASPFHPRHTEYPPRGLRHARLLQRQQARPRAGPVQPGGPRGVLGPGALGRRPRRELLGRARSSGWGSATRSWRRPTRG